MSRRFVKAFPALASGFEIETELTVHALELRLPIAEVQTPYRDRPPGSQSKLRTFRDGWRILRTIFYLVKEERPLQFFSRRRAGAGDRRRSCSAGRWSPSYLRTGLVPRLPTAVLATGLMLLALRELRRRPDPRHRDARSPRDEAPALPGLQGPTFRERRRAP